VFSCGAVTQSRTSLAIVLRWRPYGESDKIVTFLSRDFGKLTGIGKGAQRSRRRFANSLEPLARVRMHFRLRPGATLAFLESSELLQPSTALTDPKRFAYASYLAELVDQLTVEEHPVQELYALLDDALSALEAAPATSGLLRGFELQLLARAGYDPQLDRCAECQRRLDDEEAVHLNSAQGTLCCSACLWTGRPLVAVAPGVLVRLAPLKHLPLADCHRRQLGAVAPEAARFTGQLLALHLPRPLRSLRLIEQLSAEVDARLPVTGDK
jgi:DNA repair protein RecO (recombination protein O)